MAYGSRPYGSAPYSDRGIAPVEVVGVTGALEIAGQTGTASAGVDVAGVAGGITVTGFVGTVVAGVAAVIAGVAGALVIAGTVGTVQAGTGVNAAGVAGALEITGTIGTVEAGHNISGTPGALEIDGTTGTVVAGTAVNVSGVAGALELSGQTGTVEAYTGVNVAGVTGALEVTGQTGTVEVGHEIAGTPGALEITGQVGTASVGGTVDVAGVAGALEIAGQVGTVEAYTAANVAGVSGALELTGTVGTVSTGTAVNVAGVIGALEITGQVGTVAVGHSIAGTLGALELSGKVGAYATETGVNVAGVAGGIRITGTVGIVTATAPYGWRTPTPGDLDALVTDETAGIVGIFEVYVYRTSLGGSEWVRWSTAPLTTEPDDSLPNYEFDDRVMDFSMSSNLWSSDDARGIILGESRPNTAEVTLDNADGELDALFNPDAAGSREYHWRRRPARFRIGHPSWGYDDYVVVWAGHVDEAQSDGQTATMQLRDILERLDSPVTERVYEGNAWIGESASSVAIGTGSKSFVLPNLITNGTFGTDLSDWTAGTGWAQSSGTATKSAGTASTLAQDDVPTAAENVYRIRATLVRTAGSITVTVGGVAIEGATYSASGTIDCTFTADGSASDIAFSADAAFAGSLDDITMRQEPEAVPGEFAVVARTSALSTSWMWGEVLSWTPSTGTLVVDVDTTGGSGTFSDWSIWLRSDEGGADMAGKIVPDPLGIVRRFEPDYLGSVQGHILYRGAIGVWSVSSAYDGAVGIPIAGSFPPGTGEVYIDENRGLAWVANDVTPDLPFTVDVVAGSGTLSGRRVWTQPGSYSFVVPSGVTSIRFRGWAGGGGGGPGTGTGGGGAFVDSTLSVTPGETLLVVIGAGGRYPSATYPIYGTFFAPGGASVLGPGGSGDGSGGIGAAETEWGGGGGGASGLKRGSTRLIVVGGGGGGAQNRAGGGGGDDGGDGSAKDGKAGQDTIAGDGGTTTTPGVTGANGQDGDPSGDTGRGGTGRAGGGGGWHGGGGGASDSIEGDGGGGGGSSEDAGGTTENGSADTPGGATDAEWDGVAGYGGAATEDGQDGRVVITYSQTLTGLDPTGGNLLRDVLRDRRGYRLIEIDESDLVSITADAASKTFSFGASLAPYGLQELDVFSLAGTSANAGTLFTVQSATDTTITVKETVADMAWAASPLWNAADSGGGTTVSGGGTIATHGAAGSARSTVAASGKRYVEAVWAGGSLSSIMRFGLATSSHTITNGPGEDTNSWIINSFGTLRTNATSGTDYTNFVAGDIIMLAHDNAAGKAWLGRNGTWFGSADPAAGTGEHFSGLPSGVYLVCGTTTSGGGRTTELLNVDDYTYSAPAGFAAGWGAATDSTFSMTIGEVDGTALAALDAVTDQMGYPLRDNGESARRVVDQILGSLGWFLDVTRHGLVTMGAFGSPEETADHTIDEDAEGDIFEIVRVPAAPALWRVRAGAERCWRVHSKPEIASGTADADRKFVLSEWRENPPAIGTDDDVRTKDLAAEETFFPTLFAFRASLTTRVPEWLSWFSPDRQAYRITLGPKVWAIRQGDTVAVTAPSIGITEPVNMVVIGRDVEHAAMTGRIIVWR